MKVLCVIDSFGSGGAQRQMVNLALGLKARGHEVEFFIYFPKLDFFRPLVDRADIPVHEVDKRGGGFSLKVLMALIRLMQPSRFDVVISFLDSPNVYAELAKVAVWRTPLIVSERSSHHGDKSRLGPSIRRALHVVADKVVANNHSHADWLRKMFWLREKTAVIYNGVDVGEAAGIDPYESLADLKLLAVGRVGPEKNTVGIIKALLILYERHGLVPKVRWVGKRDVSSSGIEYCRQVDDLLNAHPEIASNWEWLGERADVPQILADHHVLIHASFYEGLPNAVCEALAAGRIVLASNVCDHPRLVEDGKRGFLFDPNTPGTIADAIDRLVGLSPIQWRSFSANCASYAAQNLDTDTMVDAFERLLVESMSSRRL